MKDKEIRKILIEYLKATNEEIRIYQEKSIGSAICDVMAVTDKLIGFEIKSDGDNYQRLDRQAEYYNKFFDENYIVVSEKHIVSAETRVPKDWGIIYIADDAVKIFRKSCANKLVSRRSQLSVLWKLELKNLLIKNQLPTYALKDKGYISDEIYRQVEFSVLGKQIAYELLHRDYSIFDAEDYTIYNKNDAFKNVPVYDIIDALSEENFEQITLDQWISLYQQAKIIQKEKEVIYEKKEVIRDPHEITFENIEVSLGVPWISGKIIDDFINDIFFENAYKRSWVDYEPVTGAWHINEKKSGFISNSNINVKYGTSRYNALQITEATLNLREIKLYDNHNKFDEAETLAVLDKQKLINERFKVWVWEDEDRKWLIEDAYNKLFSKFKNEKYEGKTLKFPEMNSAFSLFDYQKDAIQRIITKKNTLLAFDVGAGKTYIMIAAAMKMKEIGISQKNMFVVPNNIVGQWEKIFTTLYPKAKVLTIEPKTFKPQMRQKALTQVKNGDYDGIIIAYSCFEMIPLSVKYITDDMQRKLKKIEGAIKNLRTSNRYVWGETALQREIQYIKTLTKDLLKTPAKYHVDIAFEDLEINTIFLDEAHNYKNIPIRTKLKNLRGINTKGSKQCLEMLQKIRCVQEHNNGRGAVLATGTPLCNSISDAYTMQMYLQYDELCESNLDKFDNWVKTFAMPEQICEVDITASNYRFVRRFAKFFNLLELSKMFSDIAAFYSMDNADGRPKNVCYMDIIVNKSNELKEYMDDICKRTEEIRTGKVDRKYDNMLKVSTDGRKAALDLTLVNSVQTYDKYSKLFLCSEKIMDIYEKYPNSSQLVFCDYSTPKREDFSVYEKMKELLVKRGIPEKEIAFVHSYKSEITRLKMYDAVNQAKIKVLIGSTFKLGIGANVQTKLKAIHHLDVPWRPADMTQREGRILRRGNENNDVLIFRYITKGSFDSYSWQILETKQRFISQFLSGSTYQRSIEDLDNNVLSYAEVKAIAIGNPTMKQIAEKENEIKTLQILCNKHTDNRQNFEKRLKELNEEIKSSKRRCIMTKRNKNHLKNITDEIYLRDIKQYQKTLTKEFIDKSAGDMVLFSFVGFDVCTPLNQSSQKPYVLLRCNDIDYKLEVGNSASGNIKRITNFLKNFDKTVKEEEEKQNSKIKERDEIKRALSLPNELLDKLKQAKAELDELMEVARRNKLVS
ncbi:MAG: sce7726 family protein [Clostridia bacterium]|nr:sce7726 family protein [Clostridia bacterium]